jgi:nitroreductase
MALMDIVKQRKSVRKYLETPIPREHLIQCIEAARLSPSADNNMRLFGLLFLKFSRDDETQADELGLRYMERENYAPLKRRHGSSFPSRA